jgi:hypothetical protein
MLHEANIQFLWHLQITENIREVFTYDYELWLTVLQSQDS